MNDLDMVICAIFIAGLIVGALIMAGFAFLFVDWEWVFRELTYMYECGT